MPFYRFDPLPSIIVDRKGDRTIGWKEALEQCRVSALWYRRYLEVAIGNSFSATELIFTKGLSGFESDTERNAAISSHLSRKGLVWSRENQLPRSFCFPFSFFVSLSIRILNTEICFPSSSPLFLCRSLRYYERLTLSNFLVLFILNILLCFILRCLGVYYV